MLPLGCSISTSSESLSEATTSSSRSSTSSSPGRESAYRDDVRDFTAASVRSGNRLDALQRGLGDLARSHGITNWEEDPGTYDAIGRGLGAAGIDGVELDAYKTTLAGADSSKLEALERGYHSRQE
jgi:hypothetical protein